MNDPGATEGDDNVIIGTRRVRGSRNVVIDPGQGAIAVGQRASAGPGSVAIGAGAGAGTALVFELQRLEALFKQAGGQRGAQAAAALLSEIQAPKPDRGKIESLWGAISKAATTNEAISLLARIAPLLPHHL